MERQKSGTQSQYARAAVACALLLLLACALAGWRRARRDEQAVDLPVVRPVVGDLKAAVTATGTLYPSHSIDIKFDGQEIVRRLNVQEGDHVAAGQVLAVMDTRVLEHARSENMQTMEKDAASLEQAQAAFHREQALYDNGIAARADYETTQATFHGLLHQRAADREAALETAQQMDRAVLRSPIDGRVIAVYVNAGEMLGSATAVAALGPSASVSKPTNVLMTIAEQGPLEVYTAVNAADLGAVNAGQQALISIDAFQPAIFHGRVERIALEPVLLNNVTTYQAIVTLADSDPRFRLGLPADVMLLHTLARQRTLVPARALSIERGAAAVCVVTPSTKPQAKLTPVKIAAQTEDAVALPAPLPAGALVALDASLCRSPRARYRLQMQPFQPNPTFFGHAAQPTKDAGQVANLSPPQSRSWLQSVLGL